jgi:hypothetical protein
MAFNFTPTHLHLLLNHFPTIGFIIGLSLFVLALIAKSDHLKMGSPRGARRHLHRHHSHLHHRQRGGRGDLHRHQPAGSVSRRVTSRSLIEQHEGAALWALLFMVVTGGFAWLGLWQWQRFGAMAKWNHLVVLGMGVVTLATVSRAAALGGEIRHPEIRVTADSSTKAFGRLAGDFISNTPWTWVTAETLHFIGLTLLLGVLTLILFKVLGIIPTLTYNALDRLLPWAILGFGLNVVTGMAFFAAAPYQYIHNVAFYYKLAFIMAAGLITLLYTFDPTWDPQGRAGVGRSKLLASAALFLWVGVMFWGSMLPFIGNAF